MTIGCGGNSSAPSKAIWEVLAEAQRRGFVGVGDLERHVDHARGFAEALAAVGVEPGEEVVDLGSGGGLPGLVLADLWPQARMTLLEGSARRSKFLESAVRRCGFEDRVKVLGERAEVVGRDPAYRGRAAVVVARAFGSPAETAECASPLLDRRGVLVVSEPPGTGGERWAPAGPRTGLVLVAVLRNDGGTFAVLRQEEECPPALPRRVGVPRRRPLW